MTNDTIARALLQELKERHRDLDVFNDGYPSPVVFRIAVRDPATLLHVADVNVGEDYIETLKGQTKHRYPLGDPDCLTDVFRDVRVFIENYNLWRLTQAISSGGQSPTSTSPPAPSSTKTSPSS